MADNHNDPQTVSWQSAFFSIALIAFNSMCQEGGDVCGLPSTDAAGWLSSPFFCAADALDNLTHIVRQYIRQASLRNAIKSAAVRQRLYKQAEQQGESPKPTLKTFALHVMLPIAAVLQLVKLMGYRGVLWTQTFALMCMTDFLLREAMHWFAVQRPPEVLSDFRQPSEWAFGVDRTSAAPVSGPIITFLVASPLYLAWLSQIGFWTLLGLQLEGFYGSKCHHPGLQDALLTLNVLVAMFICTPFVSLLIMAPLFLLAGAIAYLVVLILRPCVVSPSTDGFLNLTVGLACPMGMIFRACYDPMGAYQETMKQHVTNACDRLVSQEPETANKVLIISVYLGGILVTVTVLTGIYFGSKSLVKIWYDHRGRTAPCRPRTQPWIVIFTNLIMSLLYYCLAFDEAGTQKMPWTEYLP